MVRILEDQVLNFRKKSLLYGYLPYNNLVLYVIITYIYGKIIKYGHRIA